MNYNGNPIKALKLSLILTQYQLHYERTLQSRWSVMRDMIAINGAVSLHLVKTGFDKG